MPAGFDSSMFDAFGEPSFASGSYSDGGGGSSVSGAGGAYDASSTNGENQGIDSNVANAWWRSIHPDMAGEGIAGGDANNYPPPPDWWQEQRTGTKPYDGNWVLQGQSYLNPEGQTVDPYANAGGGQFLSTAQLQALNYPGANNAGPMGPGYIMSSGGDGAFASEQGLGMRENPIPGIYGKGSRPEDNFDPTGSGIDPEFMQWMQDQGMHAGIWTGEGQPSRTQVFDKDGKPVGPEDSFMPEMDNNFGLAMIAASSVFGGAMAGAAAGAGGAEAGSLAMGAAQGAGAGLGSGLATYGPTGEALKAGAVGGVTGGITAGLNPAGVAGITDPTYAKPINSAVGAGLKAGVTGGDVKGSVLNSLMGSGLSYGMNTAYNGVKNMDFGGDTNLPAVDDYSNGFGNYQPPTNDSWKSMFTSGNQGGMSLGPKDPNDFMSMFGTQAPDASYSNVQNQPAPTFNPDSAAWPGQQQQDPTKKTGNPLLQRFMPQQAGGGAQGPGRFDSMAGNLMGLYSAYKNRKMAGKQAGQLQSLFGPNSPYAQQLKQTLLRQDAAAGRRSQVGPRSVELQARLAEMNSKNAPMLNQLYQQKGAAGDMMLKNLLGLGMNGGAQNIWNAGRNWWDNQQGSTVNSNNDWAPGD